MTNTIKKVVAKVEKKVEKKVETKVETKVLTESQKAILAAKKVISDIKQKEQKAKDIIKAAKEKEKAEKIELEKAKLEKAENIAKTLQLELAKQYNNSKVANINARDEKTNIVYSISVNNLIKGVNRFYQVGRINSQDKTIAINSTSELAAVLGAKLFNKEVVNFSNSNKLTTSI